MLEVIFILVLTSWTTIVECYVEPFIVGGSNANIEDFPHSMFIEVNCDREKHMKSQIKLWMCSGSILNEKIALTAAHCLYGCTNKSQFTVSVGHRSPSEGIIIRVRNVHLHDKFNNDKLSNDIALLRVKTNLRFGKNVKRVAIMKKPPYYEEGAVAGWGLIDETHKKVASDLMYIPQYVWKGVEICKAAFGRAIPAGTICANSRNKNAYSSIGDSGSALVVRGYIQVGLVSYKIPDISRSLVVYTDTGFFYDWIKTNSKKLYCVTKADLYI